jgi:hypothetical protein
MSITAPKKPNIRVMIIIVSVIINTMNPALNGYVAYNTSIY